MTLQQLEYIVALDKFRHFVKAAESCGITQSTLSSMIQKLEEELDIIIFDRSSHPIRPTLAGEQLINQARIVLFHSRQMQEIVQNERNRFVGDIHLGITPTIAPYIIPKLFSHIDNCPDITMHASELHRDDLIDMLKHADIDMGIMSLPHKDEELLEIPLYNEQFLAYVSPKDPMHYEKEIDFNTMPRERLWALKHEICFQKQFTDLYDCESSRSSMYESGSVATLLRIVDENKGFTVIPELHIPILRKTSRENLRPLVNPTPARLVSLFIRRDFVRESLLNIVIDGIKNIIPEHMLDERIKKFKIKI